MWGRRTQPGLPGQCVEGFMMWIRFNRWLCQRLMLWAGRRMFNYTQTFSPAGRTGYSVIHFAISERDFTIAVRAAVDELDNPTT